MSARPARVLVVSSEEWFSRSLESILTPAEITVMRAYTGQAALVWVREANPPPDAVIIDVKLPDTDGLTVCRTLRDGSFPAMSSSTPIIISTAGPATRQLRVDALRAGAVELRGSPLDAEEFVLDLKARLNAKFDADQARAQGLTDQASGIYNARGLERRGRELVASAARQQAVFSCVVFVPGPGPVHGRDLGDRLAAAFQAQARSSDVVARTGPVEFVVLAPETDAAGAARLADRLARAVEGALSGNGGGGGGADADRLLRPAGAAHAHARSADRRIARPRGFGDDPADLTSRTIRAD